MQEPKEQSYSREQAKKELLNFARFLYDVYEKEKSSLAKEEKE